MNSPDGAFVEALVIRPLASLAEYQACADLQEEVWGRGFSERVSPAILMVANRIGGLSAGAFDFEGRLHGFVFGLTGVREGRLVHWSDMLAVRRELRDRGLGTRLKLYQRQVLLERGVDRMHWTFDPLQARNAYVNFGKLGVTSVEYVREMYGETDSPLHRGVGTDRLVATWDMRSPRVEAALGPRPGERLDEDAWGGVPRVLETKLRDGLPVPVSWRSDLDGPRLLLPVPGDMNRIMGADLALAVQWREATRAPFEHYLTRGFRVEDFRKGEALGEYLLVRPEPQAGVEGGSEGE